jgi:hypothetical protein
MRTSTYNGPADFRISRPKGTIDPRQIENALFVPLEASGVEESERSRSRRAAPENSRNSIREVVDVGGAVGKDPPQLFVNETSTCDENIDRVLMLESKIVIVVIISMKNLEDGPIGSTGAGPGKLEPVVCHKDPTPTRHPPAETAKHGMKVLERKSVLQDGLRITAHRLAKGRVSIELAPGEDRVLRDARSIAVSLHVCDAGCDSSQLPRKCVDHGKSNGHDGSFQARTSIDQQR